MADNFIHLHLHTDYSALDGAGRVKDYVRAALQMGMPALGMSDHGNLFGAYEFYHECTKAGIRPIIGIEFYVAPDTLDRKEPVFWGKPEQKSSDVGSNGAATHLTVVAATAEGLRNLYRLHHLSYTSGYYYKPRIDLASLGEYSKGLIILTGCAGSALNTRIRLGQKKDAKTYLQNLCETVGRENVYIEVMDHCNPVDDLINPILLKWASSSNLPVVATNDCHYVHEKDGRSHDALLCLQTRAKLADGGRFSFEGHGYHLRTRSEMEALSLPRTALDNTLVVAERVEDYGEVLAVQDLTRMAVAPGVENADDELAVLTYAGLHDRGCTGREYLDQADYELDVIAQMGMSHYFLTLGIICDLARHEGIRIGPGRGSAGGSVVAYARGITELDPIRHGLLFERFLNPERSGFPDIDIDVDDLKRPRLLSRIREKYGVENVAQIITFSKIGARRALLDSAFVSGMPTKVGRDLTARLPKPQFGRQPTLDAGDWRNLSDVEQDTLSLAQSIEGLIRQPGIHAAGVVISSRSVIDSQPVWQPRGVEGLVTGFDMNAQEPLGLVKFDLLGLRNLGIIDECLHAIRSDHTRLLQPTGTVPSSRNTVRLSRQQQLFSGELPRTFDDPKTFGLLASGNTLGVFQLDSPGMRGLLRKLRPSSFDDISAVLALYRPGPMGADSHTHYAERKNSGSGLWRSDWAIHPDLEEATRPILEETYGLIVYQEQVMRILVEIGGYSLSEASMMLKVFKFKDRERLAKEHDRFCTGGTARGFSDESLKRLWDIVVPFADYAFNKSHSVGYAYIAYWTAYLKANYPVEYFSALLSSTTDDPDRLSEYFTECHRLHIKLLSPDINESNLGFTPARDGIRYGLAGIRGVGDKLSTAIISKRPYKDSGDFFRRVDKRALNVKVLDALVKSGAMDGLGQREGWLAVAAEYAERASDERAKKKTGQRSIFQSRYTIKETRANFKNRRHHELEILGISLTTLPISLELSRPFNEWEWKYLQRVAEQNPGDQAVGVKLGGILTKDGRRIGGILLKDLTRLSLTEKVKTQIEALGGIEVNEVE